MTAVLVKRAEQWQWSSLWVRMHGEPEQEGVADGLAGQVPADWIKWVNTPITPKEMDRLRLTLERVRPFGSDRWVMRTAKASRGRTLRREGRPSLRQRRQEREKN